MVANLISSYLDGDLPRRGRPRAVRELEGMYAFAVVSTEPTEQEIVAARQGPPLVIGLGHEGEQFLASDPSALLAHTKDVIFLENGDLARLTPDGVEIWDRRRQARRAAGASASTGTRSRPRRAATSTSCSRRSTSSRRPCRTPSPARVDFETGEILFETVPLRRRRAARGSSASTSWPAAPRWHAALIGKFLIEELARLPVEVDYGSEYRYRDPIVDRARAGGRHLAVGRDRRHPLGHGGGQASAGRACSPSANVPGSQATRISEGVIYTHAGPEIGVASTKAFTTQLVALYLLALYLRQVRDRPARARRYLDALAHLPQAVDEAIRR